MNKDPKMEGESWEQPSTDSPLSHRKKWSTISAVLRSPRLKRGFDFQCLQTSSHRFPIACLYKLIHIHYHFSFYYYYYYYLLFIFFCYAKKNFESPWVWQMKIDRKQKQWFYQQSIPTALAPSLSAFWSSPTCTALSDLTPSWSTTNNPLSHSSTKRNYTLIPTWLVCPCIILVFLWTGGEISSMKIGNKLTHVPFDNN